MVTSFFAMENERAKELIAAYGAERVLFGTDYPMWNPAQELERFVGLRLPQRDAENILYNNAARLFGFDAEGKA